MNRQNKTNHAEPKGVWVLYVIAGLLGLAFFVVLGPSMDRQNQYYAQKYAPQPELISVLETGTLAESD